MAGKEKPAAGQANEGGARLRRAAPRHTSGRKTKSERGAVRRKAAVEESAGISAKRDGMSGNGTAATKATGSSKADFFSNVASFSSPQRDFAPDSDVFEEPDCEAVQQSWPPFLAEPRPVQCPTNMACAVIHTTSHAAAMRRRRGEFFMGRIAIKVSCVYGLGAEASPASIRLRRVSGC
jgi:hypothetical protein